MNQQYLFFANRKDGLGERLRALLNAMMMAAQFDGSYKFSWLNTLCEPSTLFHSSFIDTYITDPPATDSTCALRTFLREKTLADVIVCNGDDTLKTLQTLQLFESKHDISYSDIFNSISFSNEATSAILAARQIALSSSCIAVHARAGDIIYGAFRQTPTYTTKAGPFPIIADIVKQLHQSHEVVLFGEDDQLLYGLKSTYNVKIASDLLPTHTCPLLTALSQLVLMSRCQHIYSGSSGFALAAHTIGNTVHTGIYKVPNNTNVASCIYEALVHTGIPPWVSNFQVAYACLFALGRHRHKLSPDKALELAELGKQYDPDNLFFDFIVSVILYENNEEEKAATNLETMLRTRGSALRHLLTQLLERDRFRIANEQQFFTGIRKAAENKDISASELWAMLASIEGYHGLKF